MAADAPPTSSSLVEWDFVSVEDQFKQQEEMTKFLQKSDTTEQFIEECKKVGQKAAAIGGDFRTVMNGFLDLAAKYGDFFPHVRNVYVPRWQGLMARWNGPAGMLWSSKNLAIETANALTDYGRVLALIADIKTQSELAGAQSALRAYVANHPVDIATKVADGFKNLRIDLQDFSDDFAKYVGNFCSAAAVASMAVSIKSISQCQETIAGLNVKIQEYAMALGCSSVFGILPDIPVGSISHYVVQRNEAQANLGKVKSGIASWFDDIIRNMLLRAMQEEFEKFKPNINDICDELSSFAYIWAFGTLQSIELNVALNEGMVVLTRKKFQLLLALLIVQIEPLRDGLRVYAAQI
ncbi:hypothetical protein AGABI1DRAFT_122915 [Agaricus bisporus var. burnettii JB137-S8]|uniref:Uncharacterized protein n=1 Tax=Agaricus bisporus var. burnettii (strain JB137-S8 / ATCC MYA-4627 / FGSC 10392) TaxID=597362 RepID=K5VNK4_AGABU|nr:uncharacterized protein AGABI1DRAFT_122915 [Agaricus bisporus var. burnettii JB137-S8]EKM76044.1 hypothetical protein AGABI1DRAFT_122915 [Agaricus bisporus var. burnettii JB137-S8]